MYRYKQFITEGLVAWQSAGANAAAAKRPKDVLKQTDHYFGKGTDEKNLSISDPESKKTNVHQEVEKHIGREISINDYHEGMVATDPKKPHNRTKIGKLVTDPGIRDRFNADPMRAKETTKPWKYAPIIPDHNAKYTLSIHRGAQVAGMSNPESAPEHPTGHPWAIGKAGDTTVLGGKGSCLTHPTRGDLETGDDDDTKTLDTLHSNVKHGAVVMYGRKDGIDKFREVRVPYQNRQGHVIFHRNNSYGEHHPAFLAAAEEESKKLEQPAHGSIVYHAQRNKLYVEGPNSKLRPGTSHQDISNALNPKHKNFEKDSRDRIAIAKDHVSTPEHYDLLAKDKDPEVRKGALLKGTVPRHYVDRMLQDKDPGVRATAKQWNY